VNHRSNLFREFVQALTRGRNGDRFDHGLEIMTVQRRLASMNRRTMVQSRN
jgi:hypothetical protein